jgi:hypothetical protein
MTTPAKMPEELRPEQRRVLRDMRIGETWYVSPVCLQVDPDGSCYLNPLCPGSPEPKHTYAGVAIDWTATGIVVLRNEQGYHVRMQPNAAHYTDKVVGPDEIPVASLKVEEPEPQESAG